MPGHDGQMSSIHLDGGVIIGDTPVDAMSAAGVSTTGTWAAVPWRTIIATVGIVLGTYLLVQVVLITVSVITWIVIAGFFAIVLAPGVRRVQRRVGDRRGLATGIVVFSALAAVIGLLTVFFLPVKNQLIATLSDLPGTINDAAAGKGTFGKLVVKLHLNTYIQDHKDELQKAADKLSSSSFQYATAVIGGIIAFVTITVLTVLFLSQSPTIAKSTLNLVPYRRRESVRRTATDAAAAVSGYMIGNLLISLVAGTTAFICLVALGVPSPIVIALWVAFADLIPLVGATLGAAVGVLAAFLHHPTAGFIALAFFVIYQQIENSILYPAVMSRRVNVNPLVVLLSVLLGVQIFGIIGALLAVPASGAIQVAAKAIQQERHRERLVVPDSIGHRRTRRRLTRRLR